MKIKICSAIVFVLLIFPYTVRAQDTEEIFTIYLVRHAEKEVSAENPADPALTKCGEERAESLALFFGKIGLESIYSSNYERTKNTARPTARTKGKELQIYDPKDLDTFAKLLINKKQDALVVGHSNSTPVLAGLLSGKDLDAFDEGIYNRIYQVVIDKNKGRLHIFQTAFTCNN